MSARLLYVDIENCPDLSWNWGFYESTPVDIFRNWSILCYSYALDDEKVQNNAIKRPHDIWDFLRHPENDKKIIKDLWNLLDKADIVIGHNAKSFDIKKINSRFMVYNLPPPSPYRVVDTLLDKKRNTADSRNNLDHQLKLYKLGKKLEHEGWPMWLKFMHGDEAKYNQMIRYNNVDVIELRKYYKYILPWINNHPNMAMYTDKNGVCSKCGQRAGYNKGGFYTNKTTQYQVWRCKNCRTPLRTTLNLRENKPLVSL